MSDKVLSKQQKYQLVHEDYDGTAEYYQERYNAAEEFRAQLIDFILSLPPHAVVLDCGSGPGKEACVIAKSAQKVVALDLSANMLTKVKENNPMIETVHANMNALPFAASSFDAIWCSRAIIHIPQEDLAQTLGEADCLGQRCRREHHRASSVPVMAPEAPSIAVNGRTPKSAVLTIFTAWTARGKHSPSSRPG